MTEQKRPLPQPDTHTSAFWDACSRGALEVAACSECEHLFLPPGPCCPHCWSSRIVRRRVCGNGEVFTFAVYRRTYHPGLPAPYVVALIQLQEGPRMLSNLIGCQPEEVSVGMPVQVCFEGVGSFKLPLFQPVISKGR